MDAIKQICIDFEFDEEKIDEYLHLYDTEEKYKDIPAYEWHETQTKEQKAQVRRKKLLDSIRTRRQEEKKQKYLEEKDRRNAERMKRME